MPAHPEALTCRELVGLVTEYFDGALSPAERARFDEHVADCPGCAAYLAQMRDTLALVRATPELEDRPETAGLLAVFRGWKRATPPAEA